ncbi:hypothetical protein [Desulfocurvus sp. DL9XJH121]
MAEAIKEFALDMLTDDGSAMGRGKLQEELVGMQGTLKRKLDAGVSPAEAARIKTLAQAVDAARRVVDGVWDQKNA